MELKRGTRINNRYEILELIGTGGFGSTYKAIDHLINRYVAIKCSDRSLSHEAKILKALNNVPNISHIYDYFIYEDKHYIVMRLITGISLAEFRRKNGGTISADMIKQLLPTAMITLDQMHEEGIIHRDISPGNFIISEDNIMYLIDFGAATSLKELHLKNHNIFRHVGLESPEQLREDLQGPWSDVFSLCVTIVFLLTGEGIPSAEDRKAFDPVPGMLTRLSLTAKMQNALINGLSLDANKRYKSVKAFSNDFFGKISDNELSESYSVHYHAKTFIGDRVVNQVNEKINILSEKIGKTATTLSIFLWKNNEYCLANIGDSPIYKLSKGKLELLSKEHSLAREKIDAGLSAKPRDFHTLTRYLGKKDAAGSDMAYIRTGRIEAGDIVLVCSDGVSKVLSDNTKKRYMKIDGDRAMKKLYKSVSRHENMDNCTAIILKF